MARTYRLRSSFSHFRLSLASFFSCAVRLRLDPVHMPHGMSLSGSARHSEWNIDHEPFFPSFFFALRRFFFFFEVVVLSPPSPPSSSSAPPTERGVDAAESGRGAGGWFISLSGASALP